MTAYISEDVTSPYDDPSTSNGNPTSVTGQAAATQAQATQQYQLSQTAIQNIQNANNTIALPGEGPDIGAGTNVPPLPSNLSNPSDVTGYTSAAAGQPSVPGIFTASTSSSSGSNSLNTINNQDGASSQALNNATNNVLGTLPGSLSGVDAGMGALSFTNVSQPASSSTIKSNILHNYKNYTYRLTLQLIDPTTYNTVMQNPSTFTPTNVLIASGGIYGQNTYLRNSFFTDDFYFSSAQMTTIIGANAETRGSNVISIKFDVIEPYGCTLLNRLLDACSQMGIQNHLEATYILQIDFVGYDDNGNPVNPIPGTTKIIPIKIASMKFNVSSKGSEYKFEGIPYNHTAYDESTACMPVNFEVSATSIADLFTATSTSDWTQQLSSNTQRAETKQAATVQNSQANGVSGTPSQVSSATTSGNISTSGTNGAQSQNYKIKGIADALNSYQKYQAGIGSIGVADQFAFVFDDSIATSIISLPDRTDIKNTNYGESGDNTPKKDGARSSLTQGVYTIDYTKNAYRINAGTTIIDLINMMLKNSEYFKSQITNPYSNTTNGTQANSSAGSTNNGSTTATTAGTSNTTSSTNTNPLNYWKIVPQVSLLGYDYIRKQYARKITYHVKEYQMNNVRYPYAPQGQASTYSKDYQYIFTGENIDIIDMNMNFECLYVTAVSTFPSKLQDTSSQAIVDPTQSVSNTQALLSQGGGVFPSKFMPVSNNMSAVSSGYSGKDIKSVLASDLTASILSRAQGDMIQLDLTIVGDPDYIKQDDIFFTDSSNSPQLNGSLSMDTGEVYVRVMFKTGTDYDPDTGLLRNQNSGGYYPTQNVFSGLYKVISVVSNFIEGRFEQNLTLIRLPNQPQYDYNPTNASSTVSSERSATGNSITMPSSVTNIGSGLFSGGGVSSIDTSVQQSTDTLPEVQQLNAQNSLNAPQFTIPGNN